MKAYIKPGQVYKTAKPHKGDFDLRKFVKDTLIDFNIPVVDRCCPGPAITHAVSAVNASATITAAQLETQLLTSTSVAPVTITLPTATLIGIALGARQGFWFDFTVDNTAGANTVSLAVGTGERAVTPVIAGENTLSVASGTAGLFKLYFSSAAAAILVRLV